MRSTLLFISLLVFASCAIDRLDSSVDLDNVPEFVELTSSPISKVFLSAISMRMEESTDKKGGFNKVMALINELIHDNRKQLQQIRRTNERVKGQCLVSNNKLANRQRNFASLLRYFQSRGRLALSEKAEATNMRNSRLAQSKDYAASLKAIDAAFAKRKAKFTAKVKAMEDALAFVNGALKAVANWNPKNSTAFIQEKVHESVEAYQRTLEYPISYDQEMVQLAASDLKIRRRLNQWLNMLKASIINQLALAQSDGKEALDAHDTLDKQLGQIVKLQNADADRLKKAIANWDILIKNYSSNEKIYTALSVQTAAVLKANKEWCKVERDNYGKGKATMEAQLKVFNDLKLWLRKNYGKVRQWLRKKYN